MHTCPEYRICRNRLCGVTGSGRRLIVFRPVGARVKRDGASTDGPGAPYAYAEIRLAEVTADGARELIDELVKVHRQKMGGVSSCVGSSDAEH